MAVERLKIQLSSDEKLIQAEIRQVAIERLKTAGKLRADYGVAENK